jgi:hypothetical protein
MILWIYIFFICDINIVLPEILVSYHKGTSLFSKALYSKMDGSSDVLANSLQGGQGRKLIRKLDGVYTL